MSEFDDLLHFDAIDAAEKITGKSFINDVETRELIVKLTREHNESIRDELFLRDDTHRRTPYLDYINIVLSLGFGQIWTRSWVGSMDYDDDGKQLGRSTEEQHVFWRGDGILISIDSYHEMTNSAHMWYNWKPNSRKQAHKYTSSGHFFRDSSDELIWSGSHSPTDGLRHTISQLEGNGSFLPVWLDAPFLWLLNGDEANQDSRSDAYKEFNAQHSSHFPQHVKRAIKVAL